MQARDLPKKPSLEETVCGKLRETILGFRG